MTDEKTCNKSNETKSLSEFHRRKVSKDGCRNECKTCSKIMTELWRKNNYPKKLEIDRAYRAKDHEQFRDYAREYRKKYPEKVKSIIDSYRKDNVIKIKSHDTVNNAVKSGNLIKPKCCSACGDEPKVIHGHHCDYSKPLEVMWLCVKCHKAWHQDNTAING